MFKYRSWDNLGTDCLFRVNRERGDLLCYIKHVEKKPFPLFTCQGISITRHIGYAHTQCQSCYSDSSLDFLFHLSDLIGTTSVLHFTMKTKCLQRFVYTYLPPNVMVFLKQ